MALNRECYFRIVNIMANKVTLAGFSGGGHPMDPPLAGARV